MVSAYRQQHWCPGFLLPQQLLRDPENEFAHFFFYHKWWTVSIIYASAFIQVNRVFTAGKVRVSEIDPNLFKDHALRSQRSPAARYGSGLNLRLAGHVNLTLSFKDLSV